MPPADRTHDLTRLWLAIACCLATALTRAADPPTNRSGGLVPNVAAPQVGLTREELVRQWDLDGDGTISRPEADVARGRMRRMRMEVQASAGIDPITGKPRNLDASDGQSGDQGEGPVFRLPPEPLPATDRSKWSPSGSLPPDPKLDMGKGATTPPSTGPGGRSPSAVETKPRPISSRASWLPPQKQSPTVTGGVRAGAPAAQPGYGAVTWSDLNAGRRAAANEAGEGEAAAESRPAGGLMPTGRQPGRSGAMVLPKVPRQSTGPTTTPQPAAPAPSVERPRISADEIGGDRP